MKFVTLMCATAMAVFALLASPVAEQEEGEHHRRLVITTFDAPSDTFGTQGPSQATLPQSINGEGTVTGYYFDGFGNIHGFVRDKAGIFAVFDAAPGALATAPTSINEEGSITGLYTDANSVPHGFVRDKYGLMTTFDAPGASDAIPVAINEKAAIVGSYSTSSTCPGFIRRKHGTYTTFDAGGTGACTFPYAINRDGAVAGSYIDAKFVNHGFVRNKHGDITSFDAPGAGSGPFQGTGVALQTEPVTDINDEGAIAGYFTDTNNAYHGFVRNERGAIATFNAPGAGTGPFQGTGAQQAAISINHEGMIVGSYADANSAEHGFVRSRRGRIIKFDAPGAATGPFQGTVLRSINDEETVTGYYSDAFGIVHGFVLIP